MHLPYIYFFFESNIKDTGRYLEHHGEAHETRPLH